MKKLALIVFITTILLKSAISQEPYGLIVQAIISETDTLILQNLPELTVTAKMPRSVKAQILSNNKLVYNVKKVYPYAKLAGIKLKEYEALLLQCSSEKEQKQLMKQAEDELRDEFEEDIKKLTFKQGIILIKLVDRETGNSSYALIQELRGKFTAFFWQTFAKLFGYNLKQEYDPLGEDKDIENIVVMIENGSI